MRRTFFLLFYFFFVSSGFAQTTTPKMINLQAVLTDEGGNILYDKQESTMTFQIVDGAGQVLYEEEKQVVIHKGTMSVLVGSGNVPGTNEPTGGIPPEVLKPDGTRLLRYKLADQSIPQEDLVLVSVPYAMYAQDLATPLKSEQILDGTIRIEDLHEDLVAHIEGLTTTKTDSLMATHKSEASAHDASKISVNNRFNHLPGTTLQEVLQGLDYAIETRKQASLIVEGEVTTEAGNRVLAVTAEANTRQFGDENLQSGLTQEILDRISGDSTLQSNISAEATARADADTSLGTAVSAAQSTANSAVTAAGTAQTTANSAVTAAGTAQTTADSAVTRINRTASRVFDDVAIAADPLLSGSIQADSQNHETRLKRIEIEQPRVLAFAVAEWGPDPPLAPHYQLLTSQSHNISTVSRESNPVNGLGCGVTFTFQSNPRSANSYAVSANTIGGDNPVAVLAKRAGSFTVSSLEPAGGCADQSVTVSVVGF